MDGHFPWGEDVRESLERAIYDCRSPNVLVKGKYIEAALDRIRFLEDQNFMLARDARLACKTHQRSTTTDQLCEMIRLEDRIEALESWRKKSGY